MPEFGEVHRQRVSANRAFDFAGADALVRELAAEGTAAGGVGSHEMDGTADGFASPILLERAVLLEYPVSGGAFLRDQPRAHYVSAAAPPATTSAITGNAN